MNKLVWVSAVLLVAVVVLCFIANFVGVAVGPKSSYTLEVTSGIAAIATLVAIFVGLSAISEYGGVLGGGLLFIVAGIVPIAIFEIVDLFYHVGIISPMLVNGTTTIYGVREAVLENFSVTVGVATMLYGLLKLRVKPK